MNSSSRTAFIANGAVHDYAKTATLLKEYQVIVAIDGGLVHCAAMHIKPDRLIGDLDSVPTQLLQQYPDLPTQRFPIDKDETDLELAVREFFQSDVEKITIFGGLEKRTDHTLANLQLIRRYPGKLFLENEQEILFILTGSNEIDCQLGQTISLISLGEPASGIYSKGLKWELSNATFNKFFFSLSNICLQSKVMIRIEQGDLLCCLQK